MRRWFEGAATVDTGRRGLAVLLVAYLVLVVAVAALVHQSRKGERDALRERIDNRVDRHGRGHLGLRRGPPGP